MRARLEFENDAIMLEDEKKSFESNFLFYIQFKRLRGVDSGEILQLDTLSKFNLKTVRRNFSEES
jgi:hypothetical protein